MRSGHEGLCATNKSEAHSFLGARRPHTQYDHPSFYTCPESELKLAENALRRACLFSLFNNRIRQEAEDRNYKPPFSKNPQPFSVNPTPKNAVNGRPSRLLDVFLSFVGQEWGAKSCFCLQPTAVFVDEAERVR